MFFPFCLLFMLYCFPILLVFSILHLALAVHSGASILEQLDVGVLGNSVVNYSDPQKRWIEISRVDGYPDYLDIYDMEQNLVFHAFLNGDYCHSVHLSLGDYYFNFTESRHSNRGKSFYELYLRDETGIILDTLLRPESLFTFIQKVRVGEEVSFGSALKYEVTSSPSKKWSEKRFNDNKWKENITGQWGLFTQSMALFRKTFIINNLMETSILHVTIKAQDQVIVFINGVQIFDFNMALNNVTISHVTVPADMISEGTNVIAVCLVRIKTVSTSPIDFDLMVKTVPAEKVYQEMERASIRTEDRVETVYKQKEEYVVASVPGTLTYVFPKGYRSWINRIELTKYTNTGYPTNFTLQGLVLQVDDYGNVTIVKVDDLKHIEDDNYLYIDKWYNIDLPVSRIYDGIRFKFYQSYGHSSSVKFNDIAFYTHSNLKCKKSWGMKATRIGDYHLKRCPLNQLGYRIKRCELNLDRTPEWITDDSRCIPRYPPKGVSYVDTTFNVSTLPLGWLNPLYERLSKIVVANLTVWDDQITFPAVKNNTLGSEGIMRFTVDEELGDYVVKKLNEILSPLSEQALEKMSLVERPFTVAFNQPIYRYPFPWKTVWIITLEIVFYIVSLVVTSICVHLSIRTKVSKGTRVPMKSLTKGSDEKETLLDIWKCLFEIKRIRMVLFWNK